MKDFSFLTVQGPDSVWINHQGSIVYDSMFEREFVKLGGNLDLLHCLIEDATYCHLESGEDEIDWSEVLENYKKEYKEE